MKESSPEFMSLDPAETEELQKNIAKALFKISYGLYVVSSFKDGRPNAQVCNTVFQVTNSPVRIALAINRNNLTNAYIKSSGVLAINVIGKDGHDLVRNFGYRSGRDADKFETVRYSMGRNGAPIVDHCIACLECRVIPDLTLEVGTHTLFIAEVLDGAVHRDIEPMTYDYFRQMKKKAMNPARESKSQRWICTVCGYMHEGEQSPEFCPVCDVSGDKFILMKEHLGQTMENLAVHWDAETEESALYLAFGKKAEEEGFPEVGEAFFRVAQEEAWHAADIAQLQGKVRTTKENLSWLVDTETRTQKSKAEAAMIAGTEGEPGAKEFFIKAAKDEGRHASIFKGLLKRYFNS